MKRDVGLDLIRVLALLFMVSAHYAYALRQNLVINIGQSIFDTGASIFFFGFGMTFTVFGSKSLSDRVRSHLMFFYVVVAHNVFMAYILEASIFCTEFFAFLWIWRLILEFIDIKFKPSSKTYFIFISSVLALLLLIPYPGLNDFFRRLIEGPFPLLPWGLFVIAGLVYAREDSRRGWVKMTIITGIGGAVLLGLFGEMTGWPAFRLAKWPLTAPYTMLLVGLTILTIEISRRYAHLYERIPVLPEFFRYISANLLLLVASHYISFFTCKTLYLKFIAPLHSDAADIFGGLILGPLAAMALLMLVLKVCLWLWDNIRLSSPLIWLRARYNKVAVALLILIVALRESIPVPPEHGKLSLSLIKLLPSFCAMIYFCLEMQEWAARRRLERRREATPAMNSLT